jgi:glycosyltransferase involved in cell wall biosynthesis
VTELTVAIPTFGRDRVLVETIENVLSRIGPDMELIVVDQNRMLDAATEERLDGWHRAGALRRVRAERPSLTAARNLALGLARAEVVLFVDDDVVLSETLLEQHVHRHRSGAYAAVAGRVYQWRYGPELPSWTDPRATDNPQPLPPGYSLDHVGPIDWFIGCHVSVRRADVIDVGGYDESFVGPAFGEDTDLARRLTAAGKVVFFDSGIRLIHRRSPSGGCRIPGDRTWSGWTKSANHFLYMFRHGRTLRERAHYLMWGLRSGPLLRENFVRPWRWPVTWLDVSRALRYGWERHRAVRSPFTGPAPPVGPPRPPTSRAG